MRKWNEETIIVCPVFLWMQRRNQSYDNENCTHGRWNVCILLFWNGLRSSVIMTKFDDAVHMVATDHHHLAISHWYIDIYIYIYCAYIYCAYIHCMLETPLPTGISLFQQRAPLARSIRPSKICSSSFIWSFIVTRFCFRFWSNHLSFRVPSITLQDRVVCHLEILYHGTLCVLINPTSTDFCQQNAPNCTASTTKEIGIQNTMV